MIIDIYGSGHVAETLRRGASLRGFRVNDSEYSARWALELIIVAEDILDHGEQEDAAKAFREAVAVAKRLPREIPIILVSQVSPGTTRFWGKLMEYRSVYYQADTIIVRRAVARAARPEQFIVGCADPTQPLPLAYQQYLAAHDCPVLQMSYESAEMAKCAINYVLGRQIDAANELSAAAAAVGANYEDVERALRNDARIGPHAYLRPGRVNQHLARDIETIRRRINGAETEFALYEAYLRLRSLIPGAFDTPTAPTMKQVCETTERALRKLAERAGMAEMGAHPREG